MDRPILFGILGATLMALAAAILLPGGRPADPRPKLPWEIRLTPEGSSAVLGLELGRSPLTAAQQLFNDEGAVSLFQVGEQNLALEAFFQGINLSGLRADVVLLLEVPHETARAYYERGLRISRAESGANKVTLAPSDLVEVAAAPIAQITYLPAARLDPELIQRRFGEPTERIRETDSGVSHWLYPERGLDIAIDAKGKAVLQYVEPRDFARLAEPLRQAGGAPRTPRE